MPGGLMQLNYAPSAQAEYIYGNPQITFWKAAYRRHTNFAMESKEISDYSSTPNFGGSVTYAIPRDTADLVHKMYFETTILKKIPERDDDIHVVTQTGDRLDNLAFQYYKNPTLWWYIAQANGLTSMNIEPGTKIRIPLSIDDGTLE